MAVVYRLLPFGMLYTCCCLCKKSILLFLCGNRSADYISSDTSTKRDTPRHRFYSIPDHTVNVPSSASFQKSQYIRSLDIVYAYINKINNAWTWVLGQNFNRVVYSGIGVVKRLAVALLLGHLSVPYANSASLPKQICPRSKDIERRHPRVLARPYRTLDKNEEQMIVNRSVEITALGLRPFKSIEDEGLRELIEVVYPEARLPTRQSIKIYAVQLATIGQRRLNPILDKALGPISLTLDMWSNRRMVAFMGSRPILYMEAR